MKAHLAKLSLALLSTVFLLGCQEQASSPVGPEGLGILLDKEQISHTHGGGDKDNNEGPNVEVTLTGSIASVGAQRATLSSDGGRVSAFNAGVGFRAALALNCTAITGEANDTDGLLRYLNFAIGDREQTNQDGDIAIGFHFHVQRKKGVGQFLVIWRYPDDGRIDAGKGIRVRVSSDNVGADDDANDPPVVTTFPFHFQSSDGGTVEVRRSPSILGGPGNDKLTCSYVDNTDLDIILNRNPS